MLEYDKIGRTDRLFVYSRPLLLFASRVGCVCGAAAVAVTQLRPLALCCSVVSRLCTDSYSLQPALPPVASSPRSLQQHRYSIPAPRGLLERDLHEHDTELRVEMVHVNVSKRARFLPSVFVVLLYHTGLTASPSLGVNLAHGRGLMVVSK